ncbi:MAG: protein kinase [Clostridia bacterium]|nr:protein kinase [Clostridia bacterium]
MEQQYCFHCMNPIDSDFCSHCNKSISDASSEPHHLQPGTLLNNKYLIGTVLGQGGFGITYIGRDINLDLKIAVKEYYPSGVVNRNAETSREITASVGPATDFFNKGKERFLSEARTLAKFSTEPSIVSVRDFFTENNTTYIVMEFLEGNDLKKHLDIKGKLSFKETFSMLSAIMTALSKIHEQGLIHRDISPANIIILNNGNAKLLDFGAAREVGGQDEKSLSILLKPGYAPEEQYRSKGRQGPWTDVYALSATIYKMVTGVTPTDAMNRVFSDDIKKPSELNPIITAAQDAVILKGLSVKQEDRYQSVSELFNAMSVVANDEEEPDSAFIPPETTHGHLDDGDTVYTVSNVSFTSSEQPAPENTITEEMFSPVSSVSSQENIPTQEPVSVQQSASVQQTAPTQQHAPENSNSITASGNKKSKKSAFVFAGLFAFFALATIVLGMRTYNLHINQWWEDGAINFGLTITSISAVLSAVFAFLANKKLAGKQKRTFKKITIASFSGFALFAVMALVFTLSTTITVGDQTVARNIEDLNISATLITKTDYENLKKLKNLKTLSLDGCFLDNESVKKLSELTQLEGLSLTLNTDITDVSPLTAMTGLKELYLNGTSISDISVLTSLKDITILNISSTKVSDLSSLKKFENLETLMINTLSELDPTTIRLPESISTIEIKNNGLNNINFLKNKPNISSVYAFNNNISDISVLADYELWYIDFSANKITDFSCLSGKTISEIDFSTNKISDISYMKNINALTIDLSFNEISDISSLAGKTKITQLDLKGNKISDISPLKDLFNITSLDISHNNIEDISVISTIDELRNFQANNNRIKDISVLEKCKYLHENEYAPSLENNQIEDISALANFTNIDYIGLKHNKISDVSPLSKLNKLTNIDLYDNNISDVSSLANLTNITHLNVAGNPVAELDGITIVQGEALLSPSLSVDFNKNFDFDKVLAANENVSIYVYCENPRDAKNLVNKYGINSAISGGIIAVDGKFVEDVADFINDDLRNIEEEKSNTSAE